MTQPDLLLAHHMHHAYGAAQACARTAQELLSGMTSVVPMTPARFGAASTERAEVGNSPSRT